MPLIQIKLPDAANRFIEQQIATGKYDSASDVVVDLVEKARVQAAKEKLAELVREGMKSGEGVELTDERWKQRGSEIREEAKRRGLL